MVCSCDAGPLHNSGSHGRLITSGLIKLYLNMEIKVGREGGAASPPASLSYQAASVTPLHLRPDCSGPARPGTQHVAGFVAWPWIQCRVIIIISFIMFFIAVCLYSVFIKLLCCDLLCDLKKISQNIIEI